MGCSLLIWICIFLKGNFYLNHTVAALDPECDCPVCRSFSRAYIRHLFKAEEMLAMRLAVMHNLYFYNTLMEKIRENLDNGTYQEFHDKYVDLLDTRI